MINIYIYIYKDNVPVAFVGNFDHKKDNYNYYLYQTYNICGIIKTNGSNS